LRLSLNKSSPHASRQPATSLRPILLGIFGYSADFCGCFRVAFSGLDFLVRGVLMNKICVAVVFRACMVLALTIVGLPGPASAAVIEPTLWTRPTTAGQASTDLTSYQKWDVFTSVAANAPDVAAINPNGTADAFDSNQPASGGFLTGGGNIYSFSGVIQPRSIVPSFALGASHDLEMLVQVASLGASIDTSGLTVNGVLASTLSDYSYTEISSTELGGLGGYRVEHAWSFVLSGDPASVTLDWAWGASSASLDVLSIDTHALLSDTTDPHFPGDANGDDVVDFADLGILLNNYNQSGSFSAGDFNASGDVDFTDLGILLNNYNQQAPTLTTATAVPEPSTLLLACFGACALAVWRRRGASTKLPLPPQPRPEPVDVIQLVATVGEIDE
jgi:hypothetical protein